MELLADSVQAITFHPLVALAADRSKVLLIAVFAVERTLLLDEAHVDEGLAARVGGADEVVGAPGLTQGGHEGPPDGGLASLAGRALLGYGGSGCHSAFLGNVRAHIHASCRSTEGLLRSGSRRGLDGLEGWWRGRHGRCWGLNRGGGRSRGRSRGRRRLQR